MDELKEIESLRDEAINAVRLLADRTIGKGIASEALDQIQTEVDAAKSALA